MVIRKTSAANTLKTSPATGPSIVLGDEILTLEMVTRTQAEEWVTSRAQNRKMSKADIARYREVFNSIGTEKATWRALASEALSFNADGHLTNGQKRLSGFLASNATEAPFLCLRSTSKQTLAAMGTGRPQTLGNQLTRLGYESPELVASLVRPLHAYLNSSAPLPPDADPGAAEHTAPAVSVVEQAQTADEHRAFIRALQARATDDELLANARVFAAFWPLATVSSRSVKAFVDAIMEAPGDLKGGTGPVPTVVRNMLSRFRERAQVVAIANAAQRDRTASRRAPRRDVVQELAAAIVIGYNSHVAGQTRIAKADLEWTPGRSRVRPTPFPAIEKK